MIRPERPADRGAIFAVHEAAFGRPAEARMVEAIRASDRYVPECSLVYEEGDRVLGHVILSYVDLEAARVLELGPIGVLPAEQGRGIGSALVGSALAAADARGEPLVLVLGHPSYYPRFGFERASAFGILPPDGVPDDAFMAVRLAAYDPALRGRVVFPPAYSLSGS